MWRDLFEMFPLILGSVAAVVLVGVAVAFIVWLIRLALGS